ncbi:MAG TPA: serine hydrolase domain-containing protein, partial [Gemmatimonadales bacterium]|nr:serine hydrolase domain-containing protein [Gemmatimonadales bacterium]
MRRILLAALLLAPATAAAQGVNTLPPDLAAKVRSAVQEVVDRTHVPSASVGIVQNGRIVYADAFGMARLDPALPAKPEMRYAIGSISK